MAAVVENYVSTKKKAFVIDGGSFGHRWHLLCDYYGINHYTMAIPFARDIDYEEMEKLIVEEKPDVFLCQHHETSSGQLYNLKRISEVCHKYNVSVVVDVVSTFLAEELNMDELDLDICLTSTQKGLNIPPGLSIIFLSSKLYGYKWAHRGYYWDFDDNLNNLRRGQTPFSPATIIYLQLNYRLHQLKEYGVENNIRDIRERALYFRKLCQKYGWEMPTENPSMAITSFYVRRNGDKVFQTLIDEHDTYIMPSSQNNFFRVSHMGLQDKTDLDELAQLIHEIETA
jgi:aspartate aminotransferase-like enzyme